MRKIIGRRWPCGDDGADDHSGGFAQNYPEKKGEVPYQSSYKGNVSGVRTLMSVSGDQARISTHLPGRRRAPPHSAPCADQLYRLHATDRWYKTAILPDGDEIPPVKEFVPDKGFTYPAQEMLLESV